MSPGNPIDALAADAAQSVLAGQLTLAQLTGLRPEELDALATASNQLRRRGALTGAADLLALLMTFDPYTAEHWRAMARLQQRLGNPAATAGCQAVLALIGADPRRTSCSG